jgi:transposase
LDVATGEVTGEYYPRRGSEEFLAFMKTVAAKYVDRELHVVVNNLGTHFTTEVRDWLADNPNITLHRTPVGASWMNQIEIWFGLITRQAIRRRTFSSVKQLVITIKNYITNWNADCKPFAGPPMPTPSLPKSAGLGRKSTSLRDTSFQCSGIGCRTWFG